MLRFYLKLLALHGSEDECVLRLVWFAAQVEAPLRSAVPVRGMVAQQKQLQQRTELASDLTKRRPKGRYSYVRYEY